MSRSKEHRFQVAGKERENGWQNCGSACKWGGGWGADLQKERKKETLNLHTKPLKFKWGLAKGGGGGLVDPCKAWVPPPSSI
jgi:hypothetical protein